MPRPSPFAWITSLPVARQTALAILALVSAGAAGGYYVAEYRTLPARVAKIEQQQDTVSRTLDRVERDGADTKKLVALQLCMNLAEKRGDDWEACLLPPSNAPGAAATPAVSNASAAFAQSRK